MPTPDVPAKKDFFISYNKADRTWAEWIAWQLEEVGKYQVTIQAWDFGPGSNFVLEMNRALIECDRIVAVLSPDYLTSLYTQPEWAVYFAQDPTGAQRLVVPIRVRECELKGLLAQIVYESLDGKSESDAARALLDAVKLGRREPAESPPFPGSRPRVLPSKPRFPGALPDVWNVPHSRNPNFTEPGTVLADLHRALQSGTPAALTQALAGLGGVGKTQLAVEYAYRFAPDYAAVWWLRAEQPESLSADYAALATALDLPEKGATEQPVIIKAVRAELAHRRDWLLVFDNANSREEIRGFLPAAGGHVLITSQNPNWSGVASKLEVRKWPASVAIEFLQKRTGQLDPAAAGELAQEMDYLPLALEQAGAYCEETGKTLAGYLRLFRDHQAKLLREGIPSTGYEKTVTTTWELALREIEKASPAGAGLMNLCAFLAPEDIPRDILVAGGEFMPEPVRSAVTDEPAFDKVVASVLRYSLLDVQGDAWLSLHRLVGAVVRNRLDLIGQKRWAEAAVRVVNRAFPFDSDDVGTWQDCARLLPHAIAVIFHSEHLEVALEQAVRLSSQIGTYLGGRAEYHEARIAFERALKIGEKAYGAEHPTVAIVINNLGNVLRDLGDLAGARTSLERALKIDEEAYGAEHPTVAIRVNNLGSALRALGDLVGARAAFERALKIGEKAYGAEHPAVANLINNLGNVLGESGDPAGARTSFERALKIDEKAYGAEHPTVANRVNNLGSALQDSGDLAGARAAYERALHILRRFLGPDHPNTRLVQQNLDSLG